MASISVVRNSKFRHVVGKPFKTDFCYNGLKTEGTGDTNCAVNAEFLAMIKNSKIFIVPIEKCGRQEENRLFYLDCKHKVLDIQWSPFNDNMLASCEDHGDVYVWEIPQGGLTETISEAVVELTGVHQKKVTFVNWHPSAEYILATGGNDPFIMIWNCERGQAISEIKVGESPTTMCWSQNGSRIAVMTKENGKISLSVVEPRSCEVIAKNEECYLGSKPVQALYMPNGNILTVGSDRHAIRSIALWDGNDIRRMLDSLDLGSASNVLNIYYDPDLSILYTFGKGDGNVNYYEIIDDKLHYLNQFASSSSLKGGDFLPKRAVNARTNEIARLYKLHANKCEPISFIVPRKSEHFQNDIFPPCYCAEPALTADSWCAGKDAVPRTIKFEEILGIQDGECGKPKSRPMEKKIFQKKTTPAAALGGGEAGQHFHQQQQSQNNGIASGMDFSELKGLKEDMKKVKATVRKLCKRVTKLEELLELKESGENAQEEAE